MRAINHGEVPTYPMLWAHSADREKQVRGVGRLLRRSHARTTKRERSSAGIAAASRLHANLDFRLNSQSLAMCLTPEKCLGGRAWPNIVPGDEYVTRSHCCCGAIRRWAC